MKYFAYGSNCNPARMAAKKVTTTERVRATLPEYKLVFDKRALRDHLPETIGYANIAPAPEHTVEGILYTLDPDDRATLDASERYPDHYTRIEITVETEAGPVDCFTYQARPEVTGEGLRPSRNYLNHILEARDFLSHAYYAALDRTQTFHGACGVCDKTEEVWFIREATAFHWLCQPCREARHVWGAARGHRLSVAEATAVMALVRERGGFPSIPELLEAAEAEGILARDRTPPADNSDPAADHPPGGDVAPGDAS